MSFDFARIKQILAECLDLPGDARSAFLDRACAGNDDLRAEIESLLAHDTDSRPALDPSAMQGELDARMRHSELGAGDSDHAMPESIGPYRILEVLGEGGMGIVYRAEQTEPVRRPVAIKVLKAGMDTRSILARFEAERQALAIMNHPGIARVIDAGETARGRPYFVMELVQGVRVTDYCVKNDVPVRERLDLFIRICQAVQHAHSKGIIHRDLKPSNILITMNDGKPGPTIIDFGIAKAASGALTDKTLFTAHGQLMGTPEYMSPEQAEMEGLDVDVRTDVFSLGVLLYELLTDTMPIKRETLRGGTYADLQRILREETPPRPSERTGRAALKRDLDWIVMKAIEKDRTRRYETPRDLADDIRRYLVDEPVLAGPPSASRRLRSFVRRNRAALAVTAGVVLGVVGLVLGLAAALHESRLRYVETSEAWEESRAVTSFLAGLLLQAHPDRLGKNATIEELIDHARESIGDRFERSPAVEAQLRFVIGDALNGLGDLEDAETELRRSLAIYQETGAMNGEGTMNGERAMRTQFALAELLREQGRNDEAKIAYEELLSKRIAGSGELSLATARAKAGLAAALANLDRDAEAETLMREALGVLQNEYGDDSLETRVMLVNLGHILVDRNRYEAAESLFTSAYEGNVRMLGSDHPRTLAVMKATADLYMHLDRQDEALALNREVLQTLRRVVGDDHPRTLSAINSMASICFYQTSYDEAEKLWAELAERQNRVLGPNHPESILTLNNLAFCLSGQGKLVEALALTEQAVAAQRSLAGAGNTTTIRMNGNLGDLYRQVGDLARADKVLDETVAAAQSELESGHWILGVSYRKRGLCKAALGQDEAAERDLLAAHAIFEATFGADHSRTKTLCGELESFYRTRGRGEEAARWSESAS